MANTNPKIIANLRPMTPLEIYLLQVKSAYDNIRSQRLELDYIPPQLGGFFGQYEVMQEQVVLEITDFEVM
jgi:hypothetical protein